jgi:hypothetical protein
MDAVEAAVAVARDQGLGVEDANVLHRRHSVLVHLRPHAIVARIAITGAVLGESVHAALALASYAASRGAPVVAPAAAIDPGPHERGGVVVSFWRYVEAAGVVDPAEAGRSLRVLHDTIADAPVELPSYDPRADVARVVPLLDKRDAEVITAAAAAIALPDVALRPLHGDAHLQNVLQTADGALWIDLEGPRAGPVEWDLAALQHRALAWGEMRNEIAAAVRAYGPHDAKLVAELAGPVGVWLAAMSCLIAQSMPESRSRADARLDFVRRRYALEM